MIPNVADPGDPVASLVRPALREHVELIDSGRVPRFALVLFLLPSVACGLVAGLGDPVLDEGGLEAGLSEGGEGRSEAGGPDAPPGAPGVPCGATTCQRG